MCKVYKWESLNKSTYIGKEPQSIFHFYKKWRNNCKERINQTSHIFQPLFQYYPQIICHLHSTNLIVYIPIFSYALNVHSISSVVAPSMLPSFIWVRRLWINDMLTIVSRLSQDMSFSYGMSKQLDIVIRNCLKHKTQAKYKPQSLHPDTNKAHPEFISSHFAQF